MDEAKHSFTGQERKIRGPRKTERTFTTMKKNILSLIATGILLSTAFTPVISFAEVMTDSEQSSSETETTETTTESSEETTETTGSESTSSSEQPTTETSSSQTEETTTESTTTESSSETQPTVPNETEKPATSVPNVVPPVTDEGTPVLDHTTVPDLQEIVIVKNQTTAEFIKRIGEDARKVAHDSNLYASVMIAQAILESASGNSGLSVEPNYNLFGIKGEFQGASVTMKTQEDDGTGKLYTIDSAFRKYPSYKESLEDYAKLLKEGLSGNSEFYKGTWKSETASYKEATAFLTGRYATDTQYAEKINQLIEVYELTSYDEWHETPVKSKEQVVKETKEKKAKQSKERAEKINAANKSIAKEMKLIQKRSQEKKLALLVNNPNQFLFQWFDENNA